MCLMITAFEVLSSFQCLGATIGESLDKMEELEFRGRPLAVTENVFKANFRVPNNRQSYFGDAV